LHHPAATVNGTLWPSIFLQIAAETTRFQGYEEHKIRIPEQDTGVRNHQNSAPKIEKRNKTKLDRFGIID
jgi:hypothetical protein